MNVCSLVLIRAYHSSGKNSKVLEGVKHKHAHPAVCFSVLLQNQRSVDFRTPTTGERDQWVAGLKAMLGELGASPAVVAARKDKEEGSNAETGQTKADDAVLKVLFIVWVVVDAWSC